jgi:hypothetical protein
MRHKTSVAASVVSVLVLISCAHKSTSVDLLHDALSSLDRAPICEVSVSTDEDGQNAHSIPPVAREELFKLLRTLEPAIDAPHPNLDAGDRWQCAGVIFIEGPSAPAPEGGCPRPSFFYRINLCYDPSSPQRVIAFTFGSRESVLVPYRGEALVEWLRRTASRPIKAANACAPEVPSRGHATVAGA